MTAWNKVAAVTLTFWLLEILATTLGETSGDVLAITLNLGYLAGWAITFGAFLLLVSGQLAATRFHASLYGATIVGTTTAGTEISDMMDRTLHLGYPLGAALLLGGLIVTLAARWFVEGRLRIYPICERSPC